MVAVEFHQFISDGIFQRLSFRFFFFLVFILPVTGNEPPLFPRKRKTAKCCGIVWSGPLG